MALVTYAKALKQGPEGDLKTTAFNIVQQVTSRAESRIDAHKAADQKAKEKNPAAVALGRLGGVKGGKARAASMSPEQPRKIAKAAACYAQALDSWGKIC